MKGFICIKFHQDCTFQQNFCDCSIFESKLWRIKNFVGNFVGCNSNLWIIFRFIHKLLAGWLETKNFSVLFFALADCWLPQLFFSSLLVSFVLRFDNFFSYQTAVNTKSFVIFYSKPNFDPSPSPQICANATASNRIFFSSKYQQNNYHTF